MQHAVFPRGGVLLEKTQPWFYGLAVRDAMEQESLPSRSASACAAAINPISRDGELSSGRMFAS
jgi:hypothetical protein